MTAGGGDGDGYSHCSCCLNIPIGTWPNKNLEIFGSVCLKSIRTNTKPKQQQKHTKRNNYVPLVAIIKKAEHKNKCCTALASASAPEPEPPGKAITQNVHVTLGYGCWGGFCFCFPRVSCLVIFLLVFSSSTGIWFDAIRFGMCGCFLRRIFMGSRTNCPRQKLEANVSAVDDHCRRHHIEVRVHIWKNVKKIEME